MAVDTPPRASRTDVAVGHAPRSEPPPLGWRSRLFRFEAKGDSLTSSSRDVITDFTVGQDKIDLSMIDANTSLFARGDQAFSFIGTAGKFTAPGQLRYSYQMIGGKEFTVVEGNTDSGSAADFSIALTGHHVLTANDFFM